ncbi:MAG TPA: anti-sigma factor [Thermoleophilaceae bacterium]|nr:anti-sigma factor [Thermoleophilaceae bacterium]
MATFDQLSADQRAVVELLLQRGKSYDELAELLGMPEDRVRELARDALVTLTPVTAGQVESDWRGQLADYVLGQQTGPEATATKGHLRRSEAARAWARSLLDSLDTLYENGMPQVPAGERAVRERRPRRAERERRAMGSSRTLSTGSSGTLSPAAQNAVRRRRLLAGGGALAALLLVALLLWPIGLLTGGDEGDNSSSQASSPTRPATGRTAGIAVIAQRGSQRQVIVQATLPPNRQRQAYEVWLYNSKGDAKSLGAQVTNAQGAYQGAGPLPSDYARFKYIDVSLEPIDRNRAHSGQSVLRGRIPKLKRPSGARKGQASILGQVVLQPVRG